MVSFAAAWGSPHSTPGAHGPHHHRSSLHTVLPCSLLGGSCPKHPVQGKDKCSAFPSTSRNLVGKKAARSSKSGKPLANVLPSAREIWVQRKEKVLVVTVNEEAQG